MTASTSLYVSSKAVSSVSILQGRAGPVAPMALFARALCVHPIRLSLPSLTRRLSTEPPSRNLLYVGPINRMVARMKAFSIGSSLAATALAPALIYYSSAQWSLFAKTGLVSSGKYE